MNTGHKRCDEGVACGGHAWSADGATWSNLTIGAFGPNVRLSDGTLSENSYVERPLMSFGAEGGPPLALHVGMGRTSYHDSCNFVQLFCSDEAIENGVECGPTTD